MRATKARRVCLAALFSANASELIGPYDHHIISLLVAEL
jgi:hypothetical protein